MAFLGDLWLPIVLSSIFVFLVSAIIHMLLPIHKGEYRKLPGEAAVLAAMRGQGIEPGEYIFPHCTMKEMTSPQAKEMYGQGPVGFLTVVPNGVPSFGKSLVLWFLFTLVVGVFTAYVTSLAAPAGAHYLRVFRIAGAVATLGYAVTYLPDVIWKGRGWSTTGLHVLDGVIYGLLTAGTFGWLWPTLG